MLKIEYGSRVYIIAVFSALASLLQLLEIFIILPIPFVKIGLANAIVLFFILKRQYLIAFMVNMIRVFIGGFFSAKLFSLPFIFSFAGANLSYFAMLFLFIIIGRITSAVAISVCGAIIFNLTQYCLFVYFFNRTIDYNVTVSIIISLSLIPGVLTGIIADMLNKQDIELIKKPR
ncbi:MAG: Gx transporter family protein [Candidatus Delongbacteria bacterium]|nr:Gx transporter family protein [Candidatus Delongbacteria bacterium]MCG2761004.1 Gx transporter family protein [Candidatus Delongbacteria bacterium]